MVSDEYLSKIIFAVRRNSNSLLDEELTDIIEQGRAELIRVGVPKEVAIDETNPLVLGAIRCFARWQTGGGGDDVAFNREGFKILANDLRLSTVDLIRTGGDDEQMD